MTSKYVKLNADKTEFESAVYSSKPRQIRRLSDADAKKHNWYPVKESFQTSPDRELYRNVIDTWSIVDGYVEIKYKPEMIYLDGRRDIMKNRVHELRNEKLRGGLVFNGNNFDTETDTYQRVSGAVLSVMLDETFETDWITADNTTVRLTGPEIIELGKAYAKFEEQHIMFARDLKDSVLASDEPETFDIESGWPSNVFETTEETTSE